MRWLGPVLHGALCATVLVAACVPARGAALTLSSTAFDTGAPIPKEHTCDGADRSPPLQWRDAPAGTKSWVLIADDPDAPAGTWVHWVLYDLPADVTQLSAGVPVADRLANGAKQGVNDFRKSGYGGPCPPPGKAHRYFFTLYAVDQPTALKPRASKADVLRAISGHVLARAQIVGTYGR